MKGARFTAVSAAGGDRSLVSLRPGERVIITVRKHPAVLIWFTFTTLVGLIVISLLSNYVATGGLSKYLSKHGANRVAISSMLLVWLVIFCYMIYKCIAWAQAFLVITNERIIFSVGLPVRRSASVSISKLTSWSMRYLTGGLFFGYKSLAFQLGGEDNAVRVIEHIPMGTAMEIETILPKKYPK